MNIVINGVAKNIAQVNTLKELLSEIKHQDPHTAVALNMECVPKSKYEITPVKENDEVEILSPFQGG